MKRALKYLFLLSIAALVIGISLSAWLIHDGEWIRKKTGEYVSGITGRQFSIDGSLDIDFSLHPVISANDLHLENTSWASNPELAYVHKLRISIDLFSLFSDQVALHYIELEGLRLALEENDQGEVNWDLFSSSEQEQEGQETDDAEPRDELPFVLNRLTLKGLEVSLEAPDRAELLEFVLYDFEAVRNDDGLSSVNANGSLEDLPLQFHAHIGPLKHFIIGGGMELTLDLSLGEIDLNINGNVADSLTGQGADITVNFSGPDITWVTRQLALPDFTHGPFDFDLSVDTGDYDTRLELVGDLGQLDINASGHVDDFRHVREGYVKFEITGPDLHSLGAALGEPNLISAPYRLKADVSVHLGVVDIHTFQFEVGENQGQIVGQMGDWPDLVNTELQFSISGPDFSAWGPVLRVENLRALPFSYSGQVSNRDSSVIVTTNRLELGESHIALAGTLGHPPEFLETSLDVDLYFPDLSAISILPNREDFPPQPITLNGGLIRKEQMIWLKNMRVGLGKNTAIINGKVALSKGFLGSKISLRADIPNLASVGRYFQIENLLDVKARINADLNISSSGLGIKLSESTLGDMTVELEGNLIDLQSLSEFSARVRLAVPSLKKIPVYGQAQKLPDLPASVNGKIGYIDRHLTLSNVSGTVGESIFQFDSLLNFDENFAGSHFEFEISGPDFKPLIATDALSPLPGKYRASGRFEKRAGMDRFTGLELDLGSLQIRIDGTVDDLFQPAAAELTASVSLKSLSEFNGVIDQDFPDLPFSMDVSLSGTGSRFILDPLQARLGANDLSGSISLDLKETPVIEGQIKSDFLDLSWLTEPEEDEDGAADTGGMVFPDEPIPYREYGKARIDLDLYVERLHLEHIELSDVMLDLYMDADQFRLNSFEFRGPLGESLSGKLMIGGGETETRLEFEVEGEGLRLGVGSVEGQDIQTYPPTNISMKISGKGNTWHQLASSLDGRIRIVQGKGLIANAGLELLFSDLLSELFNTLNPFAKKSVYTGLDCSVINAVIDSGKVVIDPIIFHTEQITILSGGLIDLETEEIDLEFQTKVRKGIGISASMVVNPFIKLGGTLSSPTIELDPAGVAFSGSVAVATVGLSLIGKSLFDRFVSNRDPCGEALKKLDKAENKPGR